MNKIVNVLLMLGLVFGLAACGAKEETTVFTNQEIGQATKITFTSQKDEITKETLELTLDPKEMSIPVEDLEELFAPTGEIYNKVDGVDYTFESKDDKGIIKIVIDYAKTDKVELEELGVDFAFTDSTSLKEATTILEDAGFTKK